ncbi:MAG: DUF4153 domain-containing protein [Actinomycetota bacterium]
MSVGSTVAGSEPLARQGASSQLLAATLALSVFAAWAVPGNRLGLGAVMVAAAIAVLVVWARAVPLRPESAVYAGLALTFASMAAVRSAQWVVAVDVLAAGALGTLAVVGGGTWKELGRASVIVASRAIEAAPFLARGAGRLTAGWGVSPALRGLLLGAVLIAVFGGLFVSADRAFSALAQDLFLPDIDMALLPARLTVFVAAAVAATALVTSGPRFAHLGPPRLVEALRLATFGDKEDKRRRWPGFAPAEWTVALGLLDLLFASFVGVQLAVLFGGRHHVLRTAGLSYAEYARQGFFQLVAVAALALILVALAFRWARRRQPRDHLVLDILLGVLLVLTLVVLASALKRLLLYEEVLGYTRLRISVHAVILWLAGLLSMVMVAGAWRRGSWLPRAVVAWSAVGLLVFNLANPDEVVAERNIERLQKSGRVDVDYLALLSPDAVPALARLPENLRTCVLEPHAEHLTEPDGWPEWNLGRARARATLERLVPAPCSTST